MVEMLGWFSISDFKKQSLFEHLFKVGASVEQLAAEAYEDIFGFQGKPKEGHKPPRADIGKMMDITETIRGYVQKSKRRIPPPEFRLTKKEIGLLHIHEDWFLKLDSWEGAFEKTVEDLVQQGHDRQEAAQMLARAIRKFELQKTPVLFNTIKQTIDDAYRMSSESYKLWPWVINAIKKEWKNWLWPDPEYGEAGSSYASTTYNYVQPDVTLSIGTYLIDLISEAGPIFNQLRRENRLPQGLDINKMSWKELEEWLKEWRRANGESEAQGEVVYEFNNGWTIQKLTTPEQLQCEGDEMGHCVGGYADKVKHGESVIYSLRDRKGQPHVTIDIQGIPLYTLTEENEFKQLPQLVSPDNVPGPDQELYQKDGRKRRLWNRRFYVTEIQGQSESEPKPKYKGMIKEFFNYLSEKKKILFTWYYSSYGREWDYDQYIQYEDPVEWYQQVYVPNWEKYRDGIGVLLFDDYGVSKEDSLILNMADPLSMLSNYLYEDYDEDISPLLLAEIAYRVNHHFKSSRPLKVSELKVSDLKPIRDLLSAYLQDPSPKNIPNASPENVKRVNFVVNKILNGIEIYKEDPGTAIKLIQGAYDFVDYLIYLTKSKLPQMPPPGELPSLEELRGGRGTLNIPGTLSHLATIWDEQPNNDEQFRLDPNVEELEPEEYIVDSMIDATYVLRNINDLKSPIEGYEQEGSTLKVVRIPPVNILVEWERFFAKLIDLYLHSTQINSFDIRTDLKALYDVSDGDPRLGQISFQEVVQIGLGMVENEINEIVDNNWDYIEDSLYGYWKENFLPDEIDAIAEHEGIEPQDVELSESEEYQLWKQWIEESEEGLELLTEFQERLLRNTSIDLLKEYLEFLNIKLQAKTSVWLEPDNVQQMGLEPEVWEDTPEEYVIDTVTEAIDVLELINEQPEVLEERIEYEELPDNKLQAVKVSPLEIWVRWNNLFEDLIELSLAKTPIDFDIRTDLKTLYDISNGQIPFQEVVQTFQEVVQIGLEMVYDKQNEISDYNWDYVVNSLYSYWEESVLPDEIDIIAENKGIDPQEVELSESDRSELWNQWLESEEGLELLKEIEEEVLKEVGLSWLIKDLQFLNETYQAPGTLSHLATIWDEPNNDEQFRLDPDVKELEPEDYIVDSVIDAAYTFRNINNLKSKEEYYEQEGNTLKVVKVPPVNILVIWENLFMDIIENLASKEYMPNFDIRTDLKALYDVSDGDPRLGHISFQEVVQIGLEILDDKINQIFENNRDYIEGSLYDYWEQFGQPELWDEWLESEEGIELFTRLKKEVLEDTGLNSLKEDLEFLMRHIKHPVHYHIWPLGMSSQTMIYQSG